MHDSHVGENAELYALGLLDATEQSELMQHIRACTECERRVGEAEETVLALERGKREVPVARDERIRFEPVRAARFPAWAAIAAAFAIGLLPSLWFGTHRTAPHDVAAIAMIESHFNHAQFTGANAPPAKVIYARDRSWLYVLVTGSHRYDLYAVRGSSARLLGTIQPQPASSEIFVTQPGALEALELRDGSAVVESAKVR